MSRLVGPAPGFLESRATRTEPMAPAGTAAHQLPRQ